MRFNRHGNWKLGLLVGSCMSAALGAASSAHGQERGPAASRAGLEEVIVTAQRREERLIDVPASVSVVTGEDLTQAGVIRFTDFGQSVPGLQVGMTSGYLQPSIRGISTTLTNNDQNNVAIYVDGFYQASVFSIGQDLANIQSIEVLKGPQGSLYGRNATGGAILVKTIEPGNITSGNFTASYGRFNDYNLTGFFTAPLVLDRLSFSITAAYHENDGYIKDINCFASPSTRASKTSKRRLDTNGCNTAPFASHTARAKLKFTPSDTLSLTVGYNYGYVNDPRAYAFQATGHPGTTAGRILAGTFPAAAGYRQAFQMPDRTSLSFRPYTPDETNEVTLLGVLKTGDFGELTTHTSYLREWNASDLDADGSPVDTTSVVAVFHREIFTQAIDYDFKGIKRLDLLVGGFYFYDNFPYYYQQVTSINSVSAANPGGVLQTIRSPITTPQSYSGYIDGTYQLTDRLFLTAGVRYTNETRKADYQVRNAAGVYVSQKAPGQTGKANFHATSPRAIARYNLDDRTNVYASYSRGFKSGTYNTAPGFVVPVKPETVDAYEVGAKLARDKFQVNGSIFYYDYKNLQISRTLLNPITNAYQTAISSATNSEIYGAELNVSANVMTGLTVNAGIAYLHAKYKDFRTATGTDTRIDTNTVGNSSPLNPQDWSGLAAIRSPKFSGHIAATYTTEVARGSLALSGNLYATTAYAPKDDSVIRFVDATGATVQDTRQRRYVQPGYAILNLKATWTDPNERFSVGAYLRNATDTRYRITYTSNTVGDHAELNEPRTYGVQLGYKF